LVSVLFKQWFKQNKQILFVGGTQEMSQWWPFPFKGGWAGTSFPTRGG
jgi:hypothetical protein